MFKFALCALDVRTHACDVVAQSGLLAIGEAADQQPFDPIAVRLEIGDDRVRLVGQDDALAARVMLHRFTGDQALLLHQGQHTRGGGPGDAEFLFDGVLVYLTAAVTRQEHDDMRVAAGGFPGGLRHALAQIAVDGFGYRAHFDAENMLIHCPPYHAGAVCVCTFTPHCCIRNNS